MDDQLQNCKHLAIEATMGDLTTRITDISTFGSYLVQCGFMTSSAMSTQLEIHGEGPQRKVQRFLNTVVGVVKTSSTPVEHFDAFVRIVREELQLEDLGQKLIETCAALEEQSRHKQIINVECSSSKMLSVTSGSDTSHCVTVQQDCEYLTKAQAEQKCSELKESFISIVQHTREHLNSSKENVSKFCDDFLLKISTPKFDENVCFFQENADCISKAQTFGALFILLNTFWNYLNYGLLECIIKVKGDGKLQDKVYRYSIDAEVFQRLTKLHIFWAMDPSLHISLDENPCNPSEFKTIITELSITPESTLKDIEAIRLRVTREFRLPMFALILAKVERGSVKVTWYVHRSAVSLLLNGLTKELLEELHITSVRIVEDDKEDDCTTQQEKVPELKQVETSNGGTDSGTRELQVTMQYSPKFEGGYDCTFLEPPKELQYECVICRNVLRHPCHLDCDCDIRFCYACIKPIANQEKPCPHCNKGFTSLTSDKKLERELGQREVIYNGKTLKLKELYGFRCKHCHISFKSTSEVHDHEIECGLRPYACDYCRQYQSTCDDVTLKHWSVCPSHPVPCPNECGVSPERTDLASHVDNDCPLTVVDCDFHHAGCVVRLPRKDMPDHLREAVVTHTSLQRDFILTTMESKNEQLQIQMAQLQEQQKEIRKEMAPMKHDKSEAPKTDHMRKFGVALLDGFRFALPMLIILICAISFSMWSNYHNDLQKRNEKLYFSDFDVQFDLMNFYKHNETRTPWFSPPFYRNGYKLCLEVSTDKGTGTHLSVLVHLMRGEFDDQLEWPFRGDITIQLLNQRGVGEHHEHTIHFIDKIPDSYAGRVVNRDRAVLGYGLMKFISHQDLKSRYLKNNHLRFQIKSSTFTLAKALKLYYSDLEEQFDIYIYKERIPWVSPPFYRNGYKLCLIADLNDTHLSVYVHLMRGKFDDQLQWPFQGNVTVRLLNQRDGKYHEHTIHFTKLNNAGRVIKTDISNGGIGITNFISHSELLLHYLQNDTLRFQLPSNSYSIAKDRTMNGLLKNIEELRVSQSVHNENIQKSFSSLRSELRLNMFKQRMFVMDHFSQYTATRRSWFSSPIYADGYKMCLEVCTKSHTHIYVGIHLMQGEFDDELSWPFQGDITVELLSQSKLMIQHYERIIHFNDLTPDGLADRVINSDRSRKAHGYPNFIARDQLEPNYLLNDELHFRLYYGN